MELIPIIRAIYNQLIDANGYRGLDLWYYDGMTLIKTTGDYGYWLPQEAFKMILKHGPRYFENTPAVYCYIPVDVDVKEVTKDNIDYSDYSDDDDKDTSNSNNDVRIMNWYESGSYHMNGRFMTNISIQDF